MFVPEYDNNRTEGVADAASLRFEAPPSCAKLCGHIVNKSGDPPHQIICRVTAAARCNALLRFRLGWRH
jgi:hypothetical protein